MGIRNLTRRISIFVDHECNDRQRHHDSGSPIKVRLAPDPPEIERRTPVELRLAYFLVGSGMKQRMRRNFPCFSLPLVPEYIQSLLIERGRNGLEQACSDLKSLRATGCDCLLFDARRHLNNHSLPEVLLKQHPCAAALNRVK